MSFEPTMYLLRQPDGSFTDSLTPGTLGGNSRLRIYGRLDCGSANAALPRGYAKRRVFFADKAAAIAAGFRPCGVCMRAQYRIWKAGPSGSAVYPWRIAHTNAAGKR